MPKCEYHLLLTQYPLIVMIIEEMVSRGHVFACTKYGTWHPYQWRLKNIKLHHVWPCVVPHEHDEVGASLSNLWLSRICIEKYYEPCDGGGPIWCIMLKKNVKGHPKRWDDSVGRKPCIQAWACIRF